MANGVSRSDAILRVQDLTVHFHTREGIVRAVDGVSFSVQPGETVGIVGESGSGKSVTCYSLLGLVPSPPGRIENGTAFFDEADLLHCLDDALRSVRGQRISMIFQDPMTALNPYMSIGRQVMEPLLVHAGFTVADARARAIVVLSAVGIQDAAARLNDFPHQFSGGMRQRVMIAMALITRPALLIADEPTTALDVTVQSQILDLITAMQREIGMAVILVTHNLGVVARTCDRVLVMYAGRVLEAAPLRELFSETRHPYTKALMSAMPSLHEKGGALYTIPGMPPDLIREIAGCPFAPRCADAVDRCRTEAVALREVSPGHATACWRAQAGEL